MKKYIVGIDGGGTKSHLAVFDRSGQCVAAMKHGPLNHEVMDDAFNQLEKELTAYIVDTLASIGATTKDVAFAMIGLAGVDTNTQHKIVSAIINRIGITDYILCNDAFLGVPAGCPGGVGICAINGTGSSMAAIDCSSNTVQVGGLGHFSNDCAGSSHYGCKLLAAVYGELFKCEPKTPMTGLLFERLGISDSKDYVDKITSEVESGRITLSDLNIMFFEAVALNDEVTYGVLKESAEHYAGGISYLAKNLDFPTDRTLYVTLAGSIFVKEKTGKLLDIVTKEVCKRLPGRTVEFNILRTVPVAGAVYLAGKEAGFNIELEKISKSLALVGLG